MKLSQIIDYFKAVITVEIEGYFANRFINLCKMNNVKIWNISNLASGKIRFETTPKNIKEFKKFLRKTKCKFKIVEKKGIKFNLFKYRKRKLALVSLILVIILSYIFSLFIWKINITGNDTVSTEQIQVCLNELGIGKGEFKNNISKSRISDYLRAKLYEIAWVGVEIEGSNLNIQIVEKVLSSEKEEKDTLGNLVAIKDSIITKIVVENGFTIYKIGDIVKSGDILIEGKMYVNEEPVKDVHASGIVKGKVTYEFSNEYAYNEMIKEYTGEISKALGIKINNKNYIAKYLPKNYKYDISINEKVVSILGLDLSFLYCEYSQYIEVEKTNTYDELVVKGEKDAENYLSSLLQDNKKLLGKKALIERTDSGVKYTVVYEVEEDVVRFVRIGE